MAAVRRHTGSVEWLTGLLGVAFGGVIPAWVGKIGFHREQRAAGLVALETLARIQGTQNLGSLGHGDNDAILEARVSLLAAGVRRTYVELEDRVTRAILKASWTS